MHKTNIPTTGSEEKDDEFEDLRIEREHQYSNSSDFFEKKSEKVSLRSQTRNFSHRKQRGAHAMQMFFDDESDEDFSPFQRLRNASSKSISSIFGSQSELDKRTTRDPSKNYVQMPRKKSQGRKADAELYEEVLKEMGLQSQGDLSDLHAIVDKLQQRDEAKRHLGRAQRRAKSADEIMKEIRQERAAAEIDHHGQDDSNMTCIERVYSFVLDSAVNLTRGRYARYFNAVMLVNIFLAAILVGVETYPVIPSKVATALDWFIFSAFATELLLKMIAEESEDELPVCDDEKDDNDGKKSDDLNPEFSLIDAKMNVASVAVLVVDSSRLNREGLIDMLKQQGGTLFSGAVFVEADDGDEAVRLMGSVSHRFGWVFVGNSMAKICGSNAAAKMRRKLRYRGPLVGLIESEREFLMEMDMDRIEARFKSCGADAVLLLPLDRDSLAEAIDLLRSKAARQVGVGAVIERIPVLRAVWRFFTGSDRTWNIFDFVVVIFCIPVMPAPKGDASMIRLISRLARLARMARGMRTIPALKVLLSGLTNSVNSIGSIMLIICMVVYVYAIIGVVVFGKSNPFFFSSVPVAIVTLFRTENWADNFYIDYYGCNLYHAKFYQGSGNDTLPIYRCTDSKGSTFAVVFWVSFTILTSLILLSMFIGTLIMRMEESLEEVRIDAEEEKSKNLLLKTQEATEKAKQRLNAHLQHGDEKLDGESRGKITMMGRVSSCFESQDLTLDEEERLQNMGKLRQILSKAWNLQAEVNSLTNPIINSKRSFLLRSFRRTVIFCRSIVDGDMFNRFTIFFLLLVAVLAGTEIDYSLRTESEETIKFFDAMEWLVFTVFVVEILLRFTAVEMNVQRYLSDYWNIFDLAVTVATGSQVTGRAVIILRLLRLFRVLKLIRALPQLQVIVNSLLISTTSIKYIVLMLFVIFYVFALIGQYLFQENDPENFGPIDDIMFRLFLMMLSSEIGITDAMYTNYYGCDVYSSSPEAPCESPRALGYSSFIYFNVAVVVILYIFINLFIGVVTTALEQAQDEYNEHLEIESRLREMQDEYNIDPLVMDQYRLAFSILDCDGSSFIDIEEVSLGLRSIDIFTTRAQLKGWLREVDDSGDGVIDMPEFVMFMESMHKRQIRARFLRKMRSVIGDLKAQGKLQARPTGGFAGVQWLSATRKPDLAADVDFGLGPEEEDSSGSSDFSFEYKIGQQSRLSKRSNAHASFPSVTREFLVFIMMFSWSVIATLFTGAPTAGLGVESGAEDSDENGSERSSGSWEPRVDAATEFVADEDVLDNSVRFDRTSRLSGDESVLGDEKEDEEEDEGRSSGGAINSVGGPSVKVTADSEYAHLWED